MGIDHKAWQHILYAKQLVDRIVVDRTVEKEPVLQALAGLAQKESGLLERLDALLPSLPIALMLLNWPIPS